MTHCHVQLDLVWQRIDRQKASRFREPGCVRRFDRFAPERLPTLSAGE
jgi:hypothetical protein